MLSRLWGKIKSGVSDFISGIKIIFRGTRGSDAKGDKKLAYMSRLVQGQIDVRGVHAVRKQVIKSIENDFKRTARKGQDELEKMIQNALATPDYMRMLRRLELDEPHIRVLAQQALKETKERRAK